jgi:hypothetical protein
MRPGSAAFPLHKRPLWSNVRTPASGRGLGSSSPGVPTAARNHWFKSTEKQLRGDLAVRTSRRVTAGARSASPFATMRTTSQSLHHSPQGTNSRCRVRRRHRVSAPRGNPRSRRLGSGDRGVARSRGARQLLQRRAVPAPPNPAAFDAARCWERARAHDRVFEPDAHRRRRRLCPPRPHARAGRPALTGQ